jgi:hypothetical protein
MGRKLYWLFGLFVLSAYAGATLTGMEMRSPRRGTVPPGVRGTTGGISTWHTGYHGGK